MGQKLKFIFFILLSFILVEIGIYIYLIKTRASKIDNVKIRRGKTALVKDDLLPGEKFNPLVKNETINYLKKTWLPYLERAVYSPYKKMYIITEDEGYAGNVTFHNNYNKLELEIVDGNGNHIVSYYFKKESIPHIKFSKIIKNGEKIPITFRDIKRGDKIKFIRYNDLVNIKNSFNEVLIQNQ